VREVGF